MASGLTVRVKSVEQKLLSVEKDQELQNRIFTKLEEAVEKLQDLAESLHRLISVHDTKITMQEKTIDNLSNDYKGLEDKIDRVKTEILDKIESLETKWDLREKKTNEAIDKEIKASHRKEKTRFDFSDLISKWKWFLVGGIFVLGMLSGKFGFLSVVFRLLQVTGT